MFPCSNEKLIPSNIPINAFYKQDNLEKVKRYLFCDDICAEKKDSIAEMLPIDHFLKELSHFLATQPDLEQQFAHLAHAEKTFLFLVINPDQH